MGFVKRKCSTSGKISLAQFDESKDIFLADVAAEVLFNDIPESLIINWDQTGLSIVPIEDWTMEKGAKIVPIAHSDDKRQLTAVLAITAADEYLPPQLLYQGKTIIIVPILFYQKYCAFCHQKEEGIEIK